MRYETNEETFAALSAGREKCPECGTWKATHHRIDCQLQTVEEKAASAAWYSCAWMDAMKEVRELRQRIYPQITFWQGKYAIVKQENNVLRRRLYRQEKGKEK